jgi:hypothetical protein
MRYIPRATCTEHKSRRDKCTVTRFPSRQTLTKQCVHLPLTCFHKVSQTQNAVSQQERVYTLREHIILQIVVIITECKRMYAATMVELMHRRTRRDLRVFQGVDCEDEDAAVAQRLACRTHDGCEVAFIWQCIGRQDQVHLHDGMYFRVRGMYACTIKGTCQCITRSCHHNCFSGVSARQTPQVLRMSMEDWCIFMFVHMKMCVYKYACVCVCMHACKAHSYQAISLCAQQ